VNFFSKDDLNGENYTTKSCITKKMFTLIRKNYKIIKTA